MKNLCGQIQKREKFKSMHYTHLPSRRDDVKSFKYNFKGTNSESEYEALIARLSR